MMCFEIIITINLMPSAAKRDRSCLSIFSQRVCVYTVLFIVRNVAAQLLFAQVNC